MNSTESICCLCIKNNNAFIKFNDQDSDEITYIDKFNSVFIDIKIEDNHCFSSIICGNCLYKLKEAFEFKKQCLRSLEFWQNQQNLTAIEKNCSATIDAIKYENSTEANSKNNVLEKLDSTIKVETEKSSMHNGQFSFNDVKIQVKYEQNNVDNIDNTENILTEVNISDNEENKLETEFGTLDSDSNDFLSRSKVNKNIRKKLKRKVNKLDDFHSFCTVNKEENKYYCNKCNKNFSSYKTLRAHIVRHRTKKYLCSVCAKTFFTKPELKKHEAVHTEDRPFLCAICSKSYATSDKLSLHMKYHKIITETEHICEVCGSKFASSARLKAHMITHSEERKFQCTICEKTFKVKHTLKSHIDMHRKRTYECKKCEKMFYSTSAYYRHNRVKHIGIKNYKCKFCERDFFLPYELRTHVMSTHSTERKFSCTICDKKFALKEILNQHMNVHTGVKKYQCQYCSKCFIHSGSLYVHLRLHTGVRPYQCEFCEKGFIKSHHLSYHVKRQHKQDK